MTQKQWTEENIELLNLIVQSSHRYRSNGDWQALLMLSRVLNAGAQACFEVFSSEGYLPKTLTLEDITGGQVKQ